MLRMNYNNMHVCLIIWSFLIVGEAFQTKLGTYPTRTAFRSSLTLQATAPPRLSAVERERRRTMLRRDGPYFALDRMRGKVEFGSTANLVTQLNRDSTNAESIAQWLSEERKVALSIWDETLTTELGNDVYRLQLMTLQFVTLQLSPTVDVKMWSQPDSLGKPVFALQSVAFEPNLQILPGIGVSAQSLGIVIEVVGELRPTPDGKGVTGRISFQTAGELPPPMRLLPEVVLKAASDSINQTVAQFAIKSFQRGAIAKYREFLQTESKKHNNA